MKHDSETIDKIVKVWYNKSKKGENPFQEALDFAKFTSSVFVNEDDREYALDKFEELIREDLNK